MTMVIVKNNGDSILMAADKRRTVEYPDGRIERYDDYRKIKVIQDKYVLTFAGNVFVFEEAVNFIQEKGAVLNKLNPNDVVTIFRDAFQYGKHCFENKYGIEAESVIYLGFREGKSTKLYGFSSGDNFAGEEVPASIKVYAKNQEEEQRLADETTNFINSKLKTKTFGSYKEIADMFAEAIKRVDSEYISKNADSVFFSLNNIETYSHE